MRKILFLLALIATASVDVMAQGAKNIKINEVMTSNTASIQDEYGNREAWIEICNASFTTFNIRGMWITTNRNVLNTELSAPDRQKMMSEIPSGDPRTQIPGTQHLTFFCNSNPKSGSLHLTVPVKAGAPVWIALYDGNGVDLIDSVSVPALKVNQSYAREKDGSKNWVVRESANVTANIANTPRVNNKIKRTKEEDPHGFAITILAMGTVFTCLALLFVFFYFFGLLMDHLNTAKKIANTQPLKPVTKTVGAVDTVIDKTATVMKDGLKTKGKDKRIYIAVISMALKQYQDDVHDVESGIISIKPKSTSWNSRADIINEMKLK